MYFEHGQEIVFFTDERKSTIAFKEIKDEYGKYIDDKYYAQSLKERSDFFCIDIADEIYSNKAMWDFLNKTITNIRLFKKKNNTYIYDSESFCIGDHAIVFRVSDGSEFVIGHHLTKLGSTMTITTWQPIDITLLDDITEVPTELNLSE
ncbi:MAG: hypothetical protein LBJ00_10240 [Planctomycetaceae bacterium]|nr:hypothetical protein [Planctomycetaceae bacterium]